MAPQSQSWEESDVHSAEGQDTQVIQVTPEAGFPATLHGPHLKIHGDLTFEEWYQMGTTLKRMGKYIQWWIGDWLNEGEKRHGDKWTQALDATDYDEQSLADMKWVAGVFEPSQRREDVSWSKHKEIAALMSVSKDTALEILEVAERENLSWREVRADVKTAKADLGIINAEPMFLTRSLRAGHNDVADNSSSAGVHVGDTWVSNSAGMHERAAITNQAEEMVELLKAFSSVNPYTLEMEGWSHCQFCRTGEVIGQSRDELNHEERCPWRRAKLIVFDLD